MYIIKLIIVLFVFIFGLVFHLNNNQLVEFDYYFNSLNLSLSLLVILFFLMGAVLGVLVNVFTIVKLKRQKAKLEKRILKNKKNINDFSEPSLRS